MNEKIRKDFYQELEEEKFLDFFQENEMFQEKFFERLSCLFETIKETLDSFVQNEKVFKSFSSFPDLTKNWKQEMDEINFYQTLKQKKVLDFFDKNKITQQLFKDFFKDAIERLQCYWEYSQNMKFSSLYNGAFVDVIEKTTPASECIIDEKNEEEDEVLIPSPSLVLSDEEILFKDCFRVKELPIIENKLQD